MALCFPKKYDGGACKCCGCIADPEVSKLSRVKSIEHTRISYYDDDHYSETRKTDCYQVHGYYPREVAQPQFSPMRCGSSRALPSPHYFPSSYNCNLPQPPQSHYPRTPRCHCAGRLLPPRCHFTAPPPQGRHTALPPLQPRHFDYCHNELPAEGYYRPY